MDIHVREDWSYYKESGISHYEPCVTQYARTEYNTLLTEDEGDLISLDLLDDVVVDAVAALCEKQNIEYHRQSYDGEEPSEEQKEIEKWFAIPSSTFTFLGDNATIFATSEVPIIRATISATALL